MSEKCTANNQRHRGHWKESIGMLMQKCNLFSLICLQLPSIATLVQDITHCMCPLAKEGEMVQWLVGNSEIGTPIRNIDIHELINIVLCHES